VNSSPWKACADQPAVNEYRKNINDYLGSLAFSEVKNLKELIEWNEKHADIELPFGEHRLLYLSFEYELTV
jgi:hypothetical protein